MLDLYCDREFSVASTAIRRGQCCVYLTGFRKNVRNMSEEDISDGMSKDM